MGALFLGAVVLLGAELLLAMRREFIREGPAERTQAVFGNPASQPLKFAVMGDSTAVGLGTTPERSFPWLLGEWLGRTIPTELTVFAVSGARVDDVADEQLPQVLAAKPDLVLVEIGANDATHLTSSKKVRFKMKTILDKLDKAGIKAVVAGPPDMGTSRAFAQPLRALSGLSGYRVQRAIESVVKPAGVAYIDLAAGTRKAFKEEPKKHYSTDMFHPGPIGYELYAKTMFPAVLKAAEELGRDPEVRS